MKCRVAQAPPPAYGGAGSEGRRWWWGVCGRLRKGGSGGSSTAASAASDGDLQAKGSVAQGASAAATGWRGGGGAANGKGVPTPSGSVPASLTSVATVIFSTADGGGGDGGGSRGGDSQGQHGAHGAAAAQSRSWPAAGPMQQQEDPTKRTAAKDGCEPKATGAATRATLAAGGDNGGLEVPTRAVDGPS